MPIDREQFVADIERHLGAKFGHQGRNRMTGFDCGGLILVGANEHKLLKLEFLGYADFPTDGKFDELLQKNAKLVGEFAWPFKFDGTELKTADLVSFDFGKGTQHLAIVKKWDGRRYKIIDALQDYGVSCHALAAPFVKRTTKLKGWRLKKFA